MNAALDLEKMTTMAPRPDAFPRCRANSTRGSTQAGTMSYAPVEAVQRALLVLRTLNELRFASVGDLHNRTGMSKSTIVRMLETMISEGYVVRDNFLGGYRVTSEVQALSSGFDSTPMLIQAARDITVELALRIKWPLSIATPADGAMIVNYTTNAISPWSFPFAVLHMRLQIPLTALGRCYFAFCDDDARRALVRQHSDDGLQHGSAFGIERLLRAVEQIRARGYAVPDPLWQPKRLQFLAVPILDGTRCVGAMGTGYFRRAVPAESIERTIVAPMQEAAARIGAQLASFRRGRTG